MQSIRITLTRILKLKVKQFLFLRWPVCMVQPCSQKRPSAPGWQILVYAASSHNVYRRQMVYVPTVRTARRSRAKIIKSVYNNESSSFFVSRTLVGILQQLIDGIIEMITRIVPSPPGSWGYLGRYPGSRRCVLRIYYKRVYFTVSTRARINCFSPEKRHFPCDIQRNART